MLQALDLFPGSGVMGWLKQAYIVTKGMPGIIDFGAIRTICGDTDEALALVAGTK